jgi:hypothetical protein
VLLVSDPFRRHWVCLSTGKAGTGVVPKKIVCAGRWRPLVAWAVAYSQSSELMGADCYRTNVAKEMRSSAKVRLSNHIQASLKRDVADGLR